MTHLDDILAERERQDSKWGTNRDLDDGTWLTIATEELGECASSLLEDGAADYAEVVQLAAVAMAWVENRFRNSCMEPGGDE